LFCFFSKGKKTVATAIVETLLGVSGLSLTVDLYPFGSDTAAAAGIVLSEATNRQGLYTGTTSAGLTGLHQAFVKTGTAVFGVFDVYMTNDTSIHRLVDQAAALVVQDVTGAVPTAAAGASGGLPTVDGSNRVAGVSRNVAGSVGSVTAGVAVAMNNDKAGYALSSAGLDAISTTAPAGVASTFREMLVQVWRRFFTKSTLTATQLTTYADDGATATTTQALSDDGTTQSVGAAQ
jgi:hypothetical protein